MALTTQCITRKTKETDITVELNLNGTGQYQIDTGIGFFNHMLEGFARHGLDVDCHHTIEDTGIVLGQAIAGALGDKQGIRRYGHMILPMDEALVLCALDLSGRPYFVFDADFSTPQVGGFDTEMVREFFYAVSYNAGMNLHIKQLSDSANNHHLMEAMFKSFAKALDMATQTDDRITGVLSTKGAL